MTNSQKFNADMIRAARQQLADQLARELSAMQREGNKEAGKAKQITIEALQRLGITTESL